MPHAFIIIFIIITLLSYYTLPLISLRCFSYAFIVIMPTLRHYDYYFAAIFWCFSCHYLLLHWYYWAPMIFITLFYFSLSFDAPFIISLRYYCYYFFIIWLLIIDDIIFTLRWHYYYYYLFSLLSLLILLRWYAIYALLRFSLYYCYIDY